MTRDTIESAINAIGGLAVSMALTAALRAAGAWDAPAWQISAWFFAASFARARALRWMFRRTE